MHLIMYVLALICFALAAFGIPVWRLNLVAIGLAFLTITLIF